MNERVVVFTEYAKTLEWIVRVLTQRGYRDRLAAIQGDTPLEEREDIRARFSAEPTKDPVRVLVATDSAGEGIDLQAHCHRLVNYDVTFQWTETAIYLALAGYCFWRLSRRTS